MSAEVGIVTRAENAEAELRAASYMLDETRRVAREVIEENARLAKELAEVHREASTLEQANEELVDDLEQMARAERERDRA